MAGVCHNVLSSLGSRLPLFTASRITRITCVSQVRWRKRWLRPVLKSLYWRRIEQGPEPDRPRSAFSNWNYDSEIFAFGKRLGEDFKEETLKKAFTHESYIAKEQAERAELEVEGEQTLMEMEHNADLIQQGEAVSSSYISGYLRAVFPALPEEGIRSIGSYLLTDEMLAHIGLNLGIKDLILCSEFPPSEEMLSQTLKAVIGALKVDQGLERVHQFVQDFLLPQLIGKDLTELYNIVNPMGLLEGVLAHHGMAEPEPRLLFETGSKTIESVYMVGIYSNKQLMGKGYGETSTIAEEMAARDALIEFFGIHLSRPPLPLGRNGRSLKVDTDSRNMTEFEYLKKEQQQVLQ